MSIKHRFMLRLIRLVIRMDGWYEAKPRSWRNKKFPKGFSTGDGSELIRLIARRLISRDRTRVKYKHEQPNKRNPHRGFKY